MSARFVVRTPLPKGGITHFSPDGRLLLIAAGRSASLLDAASGEVVQAFLQDADITGAAFTPDGARLALATAEGRVHVASVETGRPERTLELFVDQDMGRGATRRVPLSGTYLAFTSDASRLVAMTTWGIAITRTDGSAPMRLVAVHGIQMALLDDRTAVLGDRSEVTVVDLETGAIRRTFEGLHKRETSHVVAIRGTGKSVSMDAEGVLKVIDIAAGRPIRSIDSVPRTRVLVSAGGEVGTSTMATELPVAMAVSPDGRTATVASMLESKSDAPTSDYSVRVWDLGSGRLKRRIVFKSHIHSAVYAPSGKTLVLLGAGLHFLDTDSLRVTRTMEDEVQPVRWTRASDDGSLAIAGSGDRVALWDLRTLEMLRSWEIPSLTRTPFNPWGNHPTCGAISHDNNRIAVGTYAGGILVLDPRTGVMLGDLRAAGKDSPRKQEGSHWVKVTHLDFDATNAKLLLRAGVESAAVVSSTTGEPIPPAGWQDMEPWKRIAEARPKYHQAFSADGMRLAVFEHPGEIELCATADRRDGHCKESAASKLTIRDKVLENANTAGDQLPLAFFPGGAQLASVCESRRSVCVWNLAPPKLVRTLRGHTGPISSISIPTSTRLLSSSEDGTLRLWNLESGDSVSLVSGRRDWAVFTEDGLFDASPTGGRLVFMVDANQALGIESFAPFNNRPDRILARFAGSPPELVALLREQSERRARKLKPGAAPGSKLPDAHIVEVKTDGRKATVKLQLEGNGGELAHYDVFVNGVPVSPPGGKPVTGANATPLETIELTPGSNRVDVSCATSDGRESHRAFVFVDRADSAPADLYFLGFGVSDYRDDRLDLRYANKDASDLADYFKRSRGGYRNVRVQVLTDGQVTVPAVQASASFLQDARPEDTVVLFIAGHGFHERDAAATYYFLTHEADVTKLSSTSVRFEMLEDLLRATKARRKLFLMDTCESGDASGEQRAAGAPAGEATAVRGGRGLELAGAPPSPFHRKLDRFVFVDLLRRTGAVVFSSSRWNEPSLESESRKNGLFTAALLEALTAGKADADSDKSVSRQELESYVTSAVSTMTGGRQHPTIDRDNPSVSIALPVLKAAGN